jgi:CheY-like chemotaxis protein
MITDAQRCRLSIVVADDNHDTATGLSLLLREAGFRVVATAYSGAEALRILDCYRPDVAILDIVMPGLDGCEVAAAVRSWQPPRPRLIALSGLTRIWDRADAAEAGFSALFSKPVPFNALRTLLESYVEEDFVEADVAAVRQSDTSLKPQDSQPRDRSYNRSANISR